MKGTLIILCLSVSLVNCGKLHSQRFLPKINSPDIGGLGEPVPAFLRAAELPIAFRICSSLSAKRQYLLTIIDTTPKKIAYEFSLERKDCKGKIIEKQPVITADISSGNPDLYFSAPESSNEFVDVITDKSLAISEVCPAVIANPSNTQIKNNTSPLGSDQQYIVQFTTDEKGFDVIQINTKILNKKGGYDPQNNQLISIYTKEKQVEDVKDLGVEKERNQYVRCTGREFTTQNETFIKSVIRP